MLTRVAAFAACLAFTVFPVHAGGPLTLDDAMARAIAIHPDLRAFEPLRDTREAERAAAVLAPPLVAGVALENAFGSGDARLLTGMELTLSLASVLEREAKPAARAALAGHRLDALANRREVARLDVLAETARRYLDVVHAQAQHALALTDVEQRARAERGALQRVRAGASPESELFAAKAAHARTRLALARIAQSRDTAQRRLAALWGERNGAFEIQAADPRVLPAIGEVSALADLLERTPDIALFADERRIHEARLQLARTAELPDVGWQLGMRRLEASNDVALVGSLSVPLGTRRHAGPGIDAARAELVALDMEREARGQALYATLVQAHGRYVGARMEVQALQREVLPLLVRAERAAERAYRAGAISYLDWALLQSEHVQAAQQALEVACEAQRALIEIQRLTGQPFVAADERPGDASAMRAVPDAAARSEGEDR